MAMFGSHANEQVCRSVVTSTQCQIRSTKFRLYRLYNYQWKLFSSLENDTIIRTNVGADTLCPSPK
jgi:hypothetical protein